MGDIFEFIFDERELEVLREVMERDDMSARAVVRRFFRLGQAADIYLRRGIELGFLDDQGDFNPMFPHFPKLSPILTPESAADPFAQVSAWEGEGGAAQPDPDSHGNSDTHYDDMDMGHRQTHNK